MKADDLNRAMNYVDEAYLSQLDAPEKEIISMKNKKKTIRILIAAAIIALMSVTAYATDIFHIHSLESGRSTHYQNFSDMDRAMAQAGLQVDYRQTLGDGFEFKDAEVREVIGRDERNRKVLTFQELGVYYENAAGNYLVVNAYGQTEEIPASDRQSDSTVVINGITVGYRQDHYKFFPEDYQLTEEDKAWQEIPGNHISYGSDAVEEKTVAFVDWQKDGIQYFIMDFGSTLSADTLLAMAGELIEG